MSQKTLRFGIVGCGRIAQVHAGQMRSQGELVAVCDTDQKKADNFAAQFYTQAYYDLGTMVNGSEGLDLVAVCTPNGLHAIHTIQILKAGCHVLCEKPMALSTEDCQSMIDAAMAAGRKVFVVKQNRFNPPVVGLKKLLDEGGLGKIYSLQLSCFWNRNESYYKDTWKGSADLDGGTLFTQFSHFIDLLYWLMGDVEEIMGLMGNFAHQGIIDFEDTGAIVLRFKTGAIATINYTVNSYRRNMEGSLTVFGEKGTVKVGGEYLNRLEYEETGAAKIEVLHSGNIANNYGSYQGSMSNHDQVYLNLLKVLNESADMSTTPYEAMKTVEIIRRIYKAVRKVS